MGVCVILGSAVLSGPSHLGKLAAAQLPNQQQNRQKNREDHFFFWSAPVAFRRVALETPEWTSRDSNHHRQSVSAGKTKNKKQTKNKNKKTGKTRPKTPDKTKPTNTTKGQSKGATNNKPKHTKAAKRAKEANERKRTRGDVTMHVLVKSLLLWQTVIRHYDEVLNMLDRACDVFPF